MNQSNPNPLAEHLDAPTFWRQSRGRTIFDVRSESEFAQGHLPGAESLPLFSDQQRAEIGTVYKHSGHLDAVLRGLNLIGPGMADLARRARHQAHGEEIFVHCWRGGLRSQSMAWLLNMVGLRPRLLVGGYKAFRHLAREAFSKPWRLRVVSGLTGAGKTQMLQRLAAAGEQVIDLEQLANHRGSAFGSLGQPPQPTTEQFENELFEKLDQCDPQRRIWIEDEGNRLGTVVVPPEFLLTLKQSPAIFLDVPATDRVDHLLEEYGELEPQRLKNSVQLIRKRLGPQHADESARLIDGGQLRQAIEIVLDYYDRTYLHAASRIPRAETHTIPTAGLGQQEQLERILHWADQRARDLGDPRVLSQRA